MKKTLFRAIMIAFLLLISLAGCPGRPAGIYIGLSFSDLSTERWIREEKLLKDLAAQAGAQTEILIADHDVKLQNEQIVSLVRKNASAIIIVAEDGNACVSAVERAAEQGIPCIAYDRFIKTPKIAAYLSFDDREAGRLQGSGLLKAVRKGRYALLGGSKTDNTAILLRMGQMDIMKPRIEKGDIKIVADQWVDRWDGQRAGKMMEGILTGQKDLVDAVAASNDDTALGVIQALQARNLAGKTAVSGGDATAAGCNAVARGWLTCTVLKDSRDLASLAVDTAMKLAKKQPLTGLENYKLSTVSLDNKLKGEIPCRFLPVKLVDKSNLFDLVVKSGYQPYDDVYRDVPEAKRPPKP